MHVVISPHLQGEVVAVAVRRRRWRRRDIVTANSRAGLCAPTHWVRFEAPSGVASEGDSVTWGVDEANHPNGPVNLFPRVGGMVRSVPCSS